MHDFLSAPSLRDRPAFTALRAPFLRRTAVACVVTVACVSVVGALYVSAGWAARYLFSAVWALVFFAATPLIFKALLFDKRPLTGLLLVGFKLFWMGVMLFACSLMARDMHGPALGAALIGGVSTPLIVLILRAIGGGAAVFHAQPAPSPASESHS